VKKYSLIAFAMTIMLSESFQTPFQKFIARPYTTNDILIEPRKTETHRNSGRNKNLSRLKLLEKPQDPRLEEKFQDNASTIPELMVSLWNLIIEAEEMERGVGICICILKLCDCSN